MAKTVLENCDNHALWTPNDAVNFPPSQDEADKQEGTGSIKVIASSDLLAALPQSANVQGYWKLDEQNGNRADISGKNNTLTDNNTVLYAAGKIGNAADFEKDTNEYLSITDAAQTGLDITGEITIAFWVKLETINLSQAFVTKYSMSDNKRAYAFTIRGVDNKIQFALSSNGGAATEGRSTSALATGTWYHIAATLNQTTDLIQTYIAGSADGDALSYTTDIYDNTRKFLISGYDDNTGFTNPFDGLIDEAIVWNKCLTAEEVLKVKNITGSCLNDYIARDLGA